MRWSIINGENKFTLEYIKNLRVPMSAASRIFEAAPGGFGAAWTVQQPVADSARTRRVAAAPRGAVVDDGSHHFETPQQFSNMTDARAEHARERAQEAASLLEIATESRRKPKQPPKKKRRRGSGSDDSASGSEDNDDEDEPRRRGSVPAEPATAPAQTFHPQSVRLIRDVLSTPLMQRDVEDQMEKDLELGIAWIGVPPYQERQAQLALGPPPNEQQLCFGCVAGGPSLGNPQMRILENFWRSQRKFQTAHSLSIQIAQYYEAHIRTPANRLAHAQGRRDNLLGTWNAASVRRHFQIHDTSYETWSVEADCILADAMNSIVNNGLYQQNLRDKSDERVSRSKLQDLERIIKLRRILCTTNPGDQKRNGPSINPSKNIGGLGLASDGQGSASGGAAAGSHITNYFGAPRGR